MKGTKGDIFIDHCCYSKLSIALQAQIYNQTAITTQIFVKEILQFNVSSYLQ